MEGSSLPLLTSIILVPAAGALIVALLPRRRPDLVRLIGIMTALLTAALAGYLLVAFKKSDDGFQFVTQHVSRLHCWLPPISRLWENNVPTML